MHSEAAARRLHGPRPRPVPGDAAVEQAGVGVTLRWDPVPGRGCQTGGGGDDAGLGEELGQLKRGGRRPMSRTGPCSVAEDVGMGGISYKSKENTS